jgi:hypothetical protein
MPPIKQELDQELDLKVVDEVKPAATTKIKKEEEEEPSLRDIEEKPAPACEGLGVGLSVVKRELKKEEEEEKKLGVAEGGRLLL